MEDRTFIRSLDDLFFNITLHESPSPSRNMNEDGEPLGRFYETPTTYADPPDELAVRVLENQNVNENNNHPPSEEQTSLSGNLVCLSKCRGWTSSTYVDVPIGLSSEISHLNGHGESSSIHDGLIPRIVITGTRTSKAIQAGQTPLCTEENDENIDEAKVPGGETATSKPYLQIPIVSHCGKGRDTRFLFGYPRKN